MQQTEMGEFGGAPSGVLVGDYTDLPSLPSQAVRLFISSTFTDMAVERNYLMKNVYPKLKDYCRTHHGLDFQIVDMRWGVREYASDDHSTTQLCLDEIKHCQDVSCGPNFVILLGERYGTTTLPAVIPASELEAILDMSEQTTSVRDWYLKDTNAVPPVYVLQPKSSQPEVNWSEMEHQLRDALQQGVNGCLKNSVISEESADKYFSSVTEQEIEKGVFKVKDANDRCVLFTRTFKDIDLNHPKAWRFIDVDDDNNEINMEAHIRMRDLVDRQMPKYLGAGNRFHYENIEWNTDSAGGLSEDTHDEYLNQFAGDFERSIRALIERQVRRLEKTKHDSLLVECLQHVNTCHSKCEQFVGRKNILDDISKYTNNESRHSLVIHGTSGCGKTSLLAMAAMKISEEITQTSLNKHNERILIMRFIGTTPASSTIESLLQSVCTQIIHTVGLSQDLLGDITNDFDELKKLFSTLLQSVPENKCLVLVLDSIDQLKKDVQAYGMRWLPKTLPERVKVVLSVIDEGYSILNNLKRSGIPNSNLISVPLLQQQDCMSIFVTWLEHRSRRLTNEQMKDVITKCLGQEAHPPLYLKLVFDSISSAHSYDHITDVNRNINDCIRSIYEKLQQKHGKLLVERALGYLTLSKNGLSETEMEDLLSLDDDVLTDVFQFHVPPIRRLPSILWRRIRNDLGDYIVTREADSTKVMAWYHRQFTEHCKTTYDPMGNGRHYYDRHKIEHVNGNSKKTTELYMTGVFKQYFLGEWADKDKPFTYNEKQLKKLGLTSPDSSARRYVPRQPTILHMNTRNRKATRFNERKLSELAHILMSHLKLDDNRLMLCSHDLFFNIEYLYSMVMLGRFAELNNITSNLVLTIDGEKEGTVTMLKREAFFMSTAISCHAALIRERPEVAVILLSNPLLQFYNLFPNVTGLIDQVDGVGRELCALVAPHQQIEAGGGHAFMKIVNHIGPVNDFIFSGSGFMYSVSEKIIGINFAGYVGKVFLNKRPADLPCGERYTMIRSRLLHNRVDVGTEDGQFEVPHGLFWQSLYVSTSCGPNIHIYDNMDCKLMGVLDVEQDVPELAKCRVEGMELLDDIKSDSVIVFLWYATGHMLIYEASSNHLVHVHHIDQKIVTFMNGSQDEDEKYGIHEPPDDAQPEDMLVGFLKENGCISCFRVQLRRHNTNDTPATTVTMSSQFEVNMPVPGSVVAITCQLFKYTRMLIYATDDNRVHYVTGVQWMDPSIQAPVEDEESNPVQDEVELPHFEHQKRDIKALRSGTFQAPNRVTSIEKINRKHEDRDVFLVCAEDRVLIMRVKNTAFDSSGPYELQVAKTIYQRYDCMRMVKHDFIIGYTGTKLEGFLVSFWKDTRISENIIMPKLREKNAKLTTAFSFNAHRLPINKLEGNEEFFATCSEDGTANIFYTQITVFAGRGVVEFSRTTGGVITQIHSGYKRSLTITEDGTCAVWDLDSGKILWEAANLQPEPLNGLVTPDEDHVVTVHTDGTVRLWNIYMETDGVNNGEISSVATGKRAKQIWLRMDTETDHLHIFTDRGMAIVLEIPTMTILHKTTTSNNIDHVYDTPGGVILACGGRLSFEKYTFDSRLITMICDADDKKWKSVLRFGTPLHRVLLWSGSIVVHIGKVLLGCNPNSRSVIPLLKDLHNDTTVWMSPHGQSLVVHSWDTITILSDMRSAPNTIHLDCPDGDVAISQDGKYILTLPSTKDGIQLIRVSDGITIGEYPFMLPVTKIAFSPDGAFAMAGVADRRLYIYAVADPHEPSHTDRLKSLSSRRQPAANTVEEVLDDPRYGYIKDVTQVIEDNSSEPDYHELLRDREPSSEDEDADSQTGDHITNEMSVTHPDEGSNQSFHAFTRHATTLDIKYNGPSLQRGAQGRLAEMAQKCKSPRI